MELNNKPFAISPGDLKPNPYDGLISFVDKFEERRRVSKSVLNNFACTWLLPSDEGRCLSECEGGRVATTFLTAHATESVDEIVNTHKAMVVTVHNKPFANVTE